MISTRDQARQLDALADTVALLGAASDDARIFRRDGIAASVVPAAPRLAMANVVVYDTPAALTAYLPDLLAAYADARVTASRVWVPDWHGHDHAGLLRRAGYRPSGWDAAMLLDLTSFTAPDLSAGLSWDVSDDVATLARIAESAEPGDATGLPAALTRIPAGLPVRVYRAYRRDVVVAALAVIDHDADASLAWVSTVPTARRARAATTLVGAAMKDARERGCLSSSIQASRMGAPIYTLLGWRTIGALIPWDRVL